jgi:hypothetical protein
LCNRGNSGADEPAIISFGFPPIILFIAIVTAIDLKRELSSNGGLSREL